MSIPRRTLFGKLNVDLFRAIESATVLAKLRGNPYVEVVHWLHQLWQAPNGDFHRLATHYGLDIAQVERDLTVALAHLPTGVAGVNDFGHMVELAIERAWVFASLTMRDQRIRGAWLLGGMLQAPDLRRVLLGISASFQRIPVAQMAEDFPLAVRGSGEDAAMAHESTDWQPALPGEASGALYPEARSESALVKYCADLTALAREGGIDPVVGREQEIRNMVDILLRRRQNNPLLTGEAGVGKTAVVEGLALAVVGRLVPPSLHRVRILSLDVGALLAGASMRGEFESRLKAVLREAADSQVPVILFVDEVHTLIGAGGQAGTGDAANLLKPALARGAFRVIGATTWSEYKKHIEKDPALTRRFQMLQVLEPQESAAVAMVRGLVPAFARHHGVTVLDEAVRAAVCLSHRYIPARQLPDKAISLLDTACARVAMSLHAWVPTRACCRWPGTPGMATTCCTSTLPDPAVRANALAALCDPDGLLGDVRDVVVSGGTAFRLTVRDVERAFAVPRPPYAPEPEGVKRQLADLHVKGDGALRALLACGNAVLGIDHWSQGALGDDAPNLGPLMHLLGCLAAFAVAPVRAEKLQVEDVESDGLRPGFQAQLVGAPTPPGDPVEARWSAPLALPAAGATHAHIVQEREQIRALLRHIRHWVERHEPSSPVTILLKQADRMWGRRFAEVAHMIPPDLMQAWDRDD